MLSDYFRPILEDDIGWFAPMAELLRPWLSSKLQKETWTSLSNLSYCYALLSLVNMSVDDELFWKRPSAMVSTSYMMRRAYFCACMYCKKCQTRTGRTKFLGKKILQTRFEGISQQ